MTTPTSLPSQPDQFIPGISNEISVAIIAIIGVVLGALLTFLTTWILDYKKSERDKKQYLFDKRIVCYSKALEYIAFLISFPHRDVGRSLALDKTYKEALEKEAELYRFYDQFAIYAKKPVLEKFNTLRPLLMENKGKVCHEEAYNDLLSVMKSEIKTE